MHNLVSSFVPDSFRSRRLQHARLPCPSSTPRAYSNSCPSSQWCHPTISYSIVPFSSHLQSSPASGSFQMSQFFASGGQSIGVSSVLPMNIQDWFPLGWTGLIFLQFKGLSRVFSITTVQKYTELCLLWRFWGFPVGSEVKASAHNVGDPGSIPGWGRSPGEGNGNPLQYSCLENPMEGGAW